MEATRGGSERRKRTSSGSVPPAAMRTVRRESPWTRPSASKAPAPDWSEKVKSSSRRVGDMVAEVRITACPSSPMARRSSWVRSSIRNPSGIVSSRDDEVPMVRSPIRMA
jgi:hypothetical protein